VLDIACGTGVVARTAARRLGSGDNVTGLDLSAPMLAAARSAAAAAAEGATIEWREGSALQLPWAEEAFDVAFCQQGLQFFPDRPTATREMHRVLAPGGKLVLSAAALLTTTLYKNFPGNPYPGHPQRDLIVGDDGQFFDRRRVASNTAWMPNQACSGSARREISPSRGRCFPAPPHCAVEAQRLA